MDRVRATRHLRSLRRMDPHTDAEVGLLASESRPSLEHVAEGQPSFRGAQLLQAPSLNRRRAPDVGVSDHAAPDEPKPTDFQSIRDMILSSYWNILLLALPLAMLSGFQRWGAVWVFPLNFLVIIPLALLLGDLTEDLALRFGDIAGGLLNATFGNIVEMILSLAALQRGLFTVVAMSLLGSVFSNQLLVTGTCFLLGGLRYSTQNFSVAANKAYGSLLMISTICLSIPSIYAITIDSRDEARQVLVMSRITAIIMVLIYAAYLYFSLVSHAYLFESDEDEDAEEPTLSVSASLMLLTGITVIVSVCSEFLTGSIEEVSARSGLSQHFIGVILLPIIGNACEHLTAVLVALRNKMDLAMSVALGSSIQISCFALPFAVLAGWVIGQPFDLTFDPVSVLMFTLSVVLTNILTPDGQSQWLMGLVLLCCYVLIGCTYLIGTFA
ncbi:unnamed protein product [Pedinophyceae sp. YPF-701]|nr:unnamed protein product [Pedinophyceae sp. YPF-701]